MSIALSNMRITDGISVYCVIVQTVQTRHCKDVHTCLEHNVLNGWKYMVIKWIKDAANALLGRKIGKIRVFPITTKIILVYVLFILLSNFSSHYISLMLYRGELVKLTRQLLAKDLKEAYNFANSQYEIFTVRENREESYQLIEERAAFDFKKKMSLLAGFTREGDISILASSGDSIGRFSDDETLKTMNENFDKGKTEGFISFSFGHKKYFGVYKYNSNWKMYLVRAEEFSEFNEESNRIFRKIAFIIFIITFACALTGIFVIDYILRFIRHITNSIMEMIKKNSIELIDMKGSQADDVTFMGMAFNALSDTINKMISIFQKFTNKDIVQKAYAEKQVRLEGSKRELTCLFSDIKSFTNMTEVLGTDIIKLLNLHYTRVIKIILGHDGIIGSIIGDALLVVYGALGDKSAKMKSYQAVVTGYKIHEVTDQIRSEMSAARDKMLKGKRKLTAEEEKVFKAVMIEVGVGIDGGDVFYGNIGSNERMTNTVIGDTVNSSSRMEGLNRIYKAPIICSEYVRDDIMRNIPNHGLEFIELDTVKVKGKDIGKKVFWPIFKKEINAAMRRNLKNFSAGLEYYYAGKWRQALPLFRACTLPAAEVFVGRIKGRSCPKNWNGIWTMDTK